jgi:hypothetical protein
VAHIIDHGPCHLLEKHELNPHLPKSSAHKQKKQEQVHQYRIPIPLHDLPRLQEGHLFIQSILDKLQCSYTLTGAITKSRRKAQARAGGSSNHCSQGVGGGTMSHCTATWTNIDFLNVTVNQLSLVHLSDI